MSLIEQGLTGNVLVRGTGNGKLTDGLSAQLLAASSDKRFGSGAIRNKTVWEWVDAENAMKYLADAFVNGS